MEPAATVNGVKIKAEPGVKQEEAGGVGIKAEVDAERIDVQVMTSLLTSVFGEVELDLQEGAWLVRVDDVVASVDVTSLRVECKDAALSDRISAAVQRVQSALHPIDCGC